MLQSLSPAIKQYFLITANYWFFTLTDGALRMLVILHFYTLGYSPLQIAGLFVFYEFFGVVTNLVGGWLGAKIGLNRTMNIGLGLQVIALGMLLVPADYLTVVYVMAAQACSGIAKDLNKMSAKSAVKALLPQQNNANNHEQRLFKLVAFLTGSKNTLKGAGFFMGGALLATLGFRGAILSMVVVLAIIWLLSLVLLKQDLGKSKYKAKFSDIFSKSPAINALSAARLFLFGARDVWFVIAVPVFLAQQLGWSHTAIGSFLALWVILYGIVQSIAPFITGKNAGTSPNKHKVFIWTFMLALSPAAIALLMPVYDLSTVLITGLFVFGALFAINSAIHSYLIVSYADQNSVSLDVGFYYMANALGRLIGTLLSGWAFQVGSIELCLWISSGSLLVAAFISLLLPANEGQ
ncbi:organoarsenical effux MFS transporter ArsJ [Algibacillus agarilyticus]|uniref:organoarsenical effux MFS transporter ArsJ n=1 Tax=Algibacillus agarilyticus TaxID=2234133 RepID=UPI000DCFAA2F|nr:organoarsenical effux MFS transporter ArsJ [Algibacillus agarilyticus]